MALLSTPIVNQYFTTLFPKLIEHFLKVLKVENEDKANFLAGKVCLALCEKILLLPEGTDPAKQFCKAYINKMCSNTYYDYGRDKYITQRSEVTSLKGGENPIERHIDRSRFELACVLDREIKLDIMESLIAALPEKKRNLFVGFHLEGKSYKELAKQLGYKNDKAAKTTNNRTLNELKKAALHQLAA